MSLTLPSQLTTSDVVKRSTLSAPMSHDRLDANLENIKNKINAVISSPITEASSQLTSVTGRLDALESANALDDQAYISILDKIYPVGSIYTTTSAFPPHETFLWTTSTWVPYGAGRVLVGEGTAGEAGSAGSNAIAGATAYHSGTEGGEYAHTLQKTEMPNHDHVARASLGDADTLIGHMPDIPIALGKIWTEGQYPGLLGSRTDHFGRDYEHAGVSTVEQIIRPRGGDQPHNNIQPYVVVHFWKRTV
jgi:microcystin-dependent protein